MNKISDIGRCVCEEHSISFLQFSSVFSNFLQFSTVCFFVHDNKTKALISAEIKFHAPRRTQWQIEIYWLAPVRNARFSIEQILFTVLLHSLPTSNGKTNSYNKFWTGYLCERRLQTIYRKLNILVFSFFFVCLSLALALFVWVCVTFMKNHSVRTHTHTAQHKLNGKYCQVGMTVCEKKSIENGM